MKLLCFVYTLGMGGRKFRLGRHRKNEERKRRIEKEERREKHTTLIPRETVVPSLTVSLPLASYLDGHVQSLECLYARLSNSLPSSWTVASTTPLTLCKLRVQPHVGTQGSHVDITTTITIMSNLEWALSVMNQPLTPAACPLLVGIPLQLSSVSAVCHMIIESCEDW